MWYPKTTDISYYHYRFSHNKKRQIPYLHKNMYRHLVNMNGGGQKSEEDIPKTKSNKSKILIRNRKAIFGKSKQNKDGIMNIKIKRLLNE